MSILNVSLVPQRALIPSGYAAPAWVPHIPGWGWCRWSAERGWTSSSLAGGRLVCLPQCPGCGAAEMMPGEMNLALAGRWLAAAERISRLVVGLSGNEAKKQAARMWEHRCCRLVPVHCFCSAHPSGYHATPLEAPFRVAAAEPTSGPASLS